MFKENLKKEIEKKIAKAQDAWDVLELDKLTDGESNSQADVEYSKSIDTPMGESLLHTSTFRMEPDLITEPINEELENDENDTQIISKDDTSISEVTQKPKSIQKKRIEEPVAEEPVALDSSPSIFVKK